MDFELDNPFLCHAATPATPLAQHIIGDMIAFTKALVVDTEESFKKISSIYSQARAWKKAVEEKRKALAEPYRRKVAEINDRAKELTDPLDEIIAIANLKTNAYHQLVEERKKKEDEELRKKAAIFDFEEIYIPPMEKSLRGDGAVTVTTIETRWKVTDLSQVPLKYLKIDEKAIERDLKLGIEIIPGIELYKEKITNLRKR